MADPRENGGRMVLSLILLNLVAGDCMEDLRKVGCDTGFCPVLQGTEWADLPWSMMRE